MGGWVGRGRAGGWCALSATPHQSLAHEAKASAMAWAEFCQFWQMPCSGAGRQRTRWRRGEQQAVVGSALRAGRRPWWPGFNPNACATHPATHLSQGLGPSAGDGLGVGAACVGSVARGREAALWQGC